MVAPPRFRVYMPLWRDAQHTVLAFGTASLWLPYPTSQRTSNSTKDSNAQQPSEQTILMHSGCKVRFERLNNYHIVNIHGWANTHVTEWLFCRIKSKICKRILSLVMANQNDNSHIIRSDGDYKWLRRIKTPKLFIIKSCIFILYANVQCLDDRKWSAWYANNTRRFIRHH